ncbi:YbhN family protein [Acidithiobacillus sp. M4-SHS-6]|uniref:lysylphosphatidylglycerol synthase transmembrane domain-containing protein n=1 Tax=Acidithiobacillus sp. M4-SHS-6 TaxID=3383024 RepID=UPI0039BDAA8E
MKQEDLPLPGKFPATGATMGRMEVGIIGAIKRSYLFLLAGSILLTLIIPFILARGHVFVRLLSLPLRIALLLAGLMLLSWGFEAQRLRILLRLVGEVVGLPKALGMVMAAEFAGAATPGATGMAATYALLLKRRGMDIGSAAGLVAVIVVFDLAFFGTFLPLAALWIAVQPQAVPGAQRLLAVIFTGAAFAALALLLLHRYHHGARILVDRVLGHLPIYARRRYAIARSTVQFLRALRVLRNMTWRSRWDLYVLSAGFWLPRYVVLWVAISQVTERVGFPYLLIVQGILNLGGQMIFLPGGAGGVGAAYAVLLSPYMSGRDIGFTLLIWRTFTYYWYLLVGAPIFLYQAGAAAHDLLSRSHRVRSPAKPHSPH